MFSWMAALDSDCGVFQSIPSTALPKASLRAAWELRKFQRPFSKPTVWSERPAQQPVARLGREGQRGEGDQRGERGPWSAIHLPSFPGILAHPPAPCQVLCGACILSVPAREPAQSRCSPAARWHRAAFRSLPTRKKAAPALPASALRPVLLQPAQRVPPARGCSMASSLVRPAILAATMLVLFLLLCLGPSKWGDAKAQGRETEQSGSIGTHFESE